MPFDVYCVVDANTGSFVSIVGATGAGAGAGAGIDTGAGVWPSVASAAFAGAEIVTGPNAFARAGLNIIVAVASDAVPGCACVFSDSSPSHNVAEDVCSIEDANDISIDDSEPDRFGAGPVDGAITRGSEILDDSIDEETSAALSEVLTADSFAVAVSHGIEVTDTAASSQQRSIAVSITVVFDRAAQRNAAGRRL